MHKGGKKSRRKFSGPEKKKRNSKIDKTADPSS
jgi:hypothetical protein